MEKFNLGALEREIQEVQKEEGLTFEDNMLTWDNADDVKNVVAALENTKIVHYLKLEGNTLGVDAAAAIGKALERHPEFRKALWRNMFTRRLKTEIPQALRHLGNGLIVAKAQLVQLDLSDNALGPNGMVGLEQLLRSPVCYTLQELRLNNCGLGIGGGQMLSKALIDCYHSSNEVGRPLQLKVFVAGRNRLENDGAKAIAKIFETLQTLEEIVMPQNSIYHVGIAALAQGFTKNPNLRILNLNDNTVTHKGAALLAEAFAYTPKLSEINFGDCLLRDNGAYHFAAALELSHYDLEVVDLGFNEIGLDGGLALVQMVEKKPKLRLFNLDGNQFGSEGRENIEKAMQNAINPNALADMAENQSECEDDGEYNDSDSDELEEDDEKFDPHNDTTEDADEYDDYEDQLQDENDAEESAYTTSQAYSTNLFSGADDTFSPKAAADVNSNVDLPKPTAETFCLCQKPLTLQTFESLQEENKLAAFTDIINLFEGDDYLFILIFTALKCAHLSKDSNEALDVARALFTKCIDHAAKTKQERRVTNFILIQLGLLRTEEKFKSPYDLTSCRFALRKTLDTVDHLGSEYMENVFKVFLEQSDA